MKKLALLSIFSFLIFSCEDNNNQAEFTGNEIQMELIPGEVNGNETTGTLVIKERTDGQAQIELTIEGVLNNANHPVHFHYGSLEDDGNIATLLNPVIEADGIGKSTTILNELENGEALTYTDFVNFDGSIKIHFQATGSLKDEIVGATNIGINAPENEVYLSGSKSITICNSEF